MAAVSHVVAAMHMTDAYDSGFNWKCECPACDSMRQDPIMLEAFWAAIRRNKPEPKTKKSPPVEYL